MSEIRPGEIDSAKIDILEDDIRDLIISFQQVNPEIKIEAIAVENSDPDGLSIDIITGRFRY